MVQDYGVLYHEELPEEKQKEADIKIDKRWKEYLSSLNKKYINDPRFFIFVNKKFYSVALHSKLDKLVEFAFGNLETAMLEFEKINQIKKSR